jgi:hypothetical protein
MLPEACGEFAMKRKIDALKTLLYSTAVIALVILLSDLLSNKAAYAIKIIGNG